MLSGAQVVPAVNTSATGTLELNLSEDGTSFECVLTVQGLTGFTLARLRVGEPGQNGEEICHPVQRRDEARRCSAG